MSQIRTKLIAIGVALALLAGGYAAVGAFAEPGATPWPDPGQGHGPVVAGQELEGTETPEVTETPEDAETVDPLETPDGVLGVPTDSPACAGDLDHPNPNDTDGDADGCREVENDEGTMTNLPDPAADAHEGNSGAIGQGDEHGPTTPENEQHGPPTGEPPFGHGHGNDDGEGEDETPTPTP